MMFFRSRIVPHTPPSLVKLQLTVASLTSGPGISTPISDHVPELMYAHPDSPEAGTAATADAVSWVPGATTGAGLSPVSDAIDGRSGPRTVPGCTTLPSIRVGSPTPCTTSSAQLR